MRERLSRIARATPAWLKSYRGATTALATLCLLLAVWVVPFQLTGQSKATVDAIAWSWFPLKVAYLLVAVTTVYCTFARIKRDIGRAQRGPRMSETPTSQAVPLEVEATLETVADTLAERGYSVSRVPDQVQAVKHRWSPLGGSVFHLAIVLFAIAVMLQHTTAVTDQVRVIEGQSFEGAAKGSPNWIRGAVAGLTLKSIRPAYYKDVLLFTRLEATVVDASNVTKRTSLSRPLWLDAFTHLSIQDYGLAPSFKVTDSKGRVVDDTTAALELNPPGARDSVEMPNTKIVLSVVAFPDYAIIDGKDSSVTYNLRHPRLRVSAVRTIAGYESARALLGVGDSMKIDGYTVTLAGIARHGTFSVFRTYATLPIALASLLMLLGLVMRLLFPRHDVVVWNQSGTIVADAWCDSYGRGEGLRRLKKMFGRDDAS